MYFFFFYIPKSNKTISEKLEECHKACDMVVFFL